MAINDVICVNKSNMYCQTASATQCKQTIDYSCFDLVPGLCRDNNKICQAITGGYCYDDPSNPIECRMVTNKECVDQAGQL